jgi:hypothetical protein
MTPPADRPRPPAVVPPIRPPAELLACPVAPKAFPREATATIPSAVRAAAIGLAGAYAAVADQLRRLIDWNDPAACPREAAAPAASHSPAKD